MRSALLRAGLGLGLAAALPALPQAAGTDDDGPPTFNRDVAPIVFESCAVCHRPGESGPFSLLDYRDVAKRGEQIAALTASRYMPPWKPDPAKNAFHGDRSLEVEEIETIARWVRAGKPEGDPADLPPAPVFEEGWALGEPDLVVEMPRPYTLPAEGRDVYRNFVLPVRVPATRWVRAVEFRPDNLPIVHHAVLFVDDRGRARTEDRRTPEVGYEGMGVGEASIPDGQFVGWVPGKVMDPGTSDVAWELAPGTDLVVQAHMRPTGKPEPLTMRLGLYFNEEPPTRHPFSIRVATRDIDIPAGEAAHTVEASYTLPVDVEAIGVYPHAHYLGKDISIFATLPDGSRRWLIHIPDWDFNWQDEYRYLEPIALPAGTRITNRTTYDNSAANPFNPNQPPIRVTHGPQSSDEMAEAVLQVMAREDDRPLLVQHYRRHELEAELAYYEEHARREPGVARWHNLAATFALELERPTLAAEHYARAVEISGGNPTPYLNLARALLVAGDAARALEMLDRLLQARPGTIPAVLERARALRALGRLDEAAAELDRLGAIIPDNPRLHVLAGEVHRERGHTDAARAAFERALELRSEHARAGRHLAELDLAAGQPERAAARCRELVHRTPDDGPAHALLGRALAASGDRAGARRHLAIAARLMPGNGELARDLLDLDAE